MQYQSDVFHQKFQKKKSVEDLFLENDVSVTTSHTIFEKIINVQRLLRTYSLEVRAKQITLFFL